MHTIVPNNYEVKIEGTDAVLYKDGSTLANWNDLLEILAPQGSQGSLANTSVQIDDIPLTTGSTLQLNISNDVDATTNLISGYVTRNSLESSKLVFTLDADTLPSTTLTDVTRIVDASVNYPGDGTLDAAAVGQRYLLTGEIQGNQWGITADANDIIEYSGSAWSIVFDASNISTVQYVKNLYTNKQYKWVNNLWTSTDEG